MMEEPGCCFPFVCTVTVVPVLRLFAATLPSDSVCPKNLPERGLIGAVDLKAKCQVALHEPRIAVEAFTGECRQLCWAHC